MDYNGGPVMPSNTDYMVLWSPAGLPAYPAGYVSGLRTYFTDLAHDSGGHQNVDSVSAQYADLTGAFARYQTTFGGALVDTDPYPPTQCPAAAPVTALPHRPADPGRARAVRRLPRPEDRPQPRVLPAAPPDVETCFSNDATANPAFGGCSAGEPIDLAFFCAYHGNTTLSPMLLYSDNPFDADNPLCQDGNHPNGIADGEIYGGLSHEHNESITDPIPNDAWTNGAGPNQGEEVGDQCVGVMGTPLGTAPNGATYNQVINGHFYWYQEEWSNQTHSCLQRLTPAKARPHAMFKVTAGSGLTLNFDARGSSAPGGVAEYVWQFNDAFGAQTVEQTTPTISHTFPSAGAYSVGLTVMAADGTSTGNGGIVTTGQNGTTPGFTFEPKHRPSGGTVGELLRAGHGQRAAGDDVPLGIRRRHHRFGPVPDPRVPPAGTVHGQARDVQRRRIGVPRRRRWPGVHAVADSDRVANSGPPRPISKDGPGVDVIAPTLLAPPAPGPGARRRSPHCSAPPSAEAILCLYRRSRTARVFRPR